MAVYLGFSLSYQTKIICLQGFSYFDAGKNGSKEKILPYCVRIIGSEVQGSLGLDIKVDWRLKSKP